MFKELGLYLSWLIVRLIVSLRYKLKVKGLDEIKNQGKKGMLFLPNHPAEMDPIILILLLWPSFRPRPLAVEHFYYQKGIRFFMDLVRAFPLPTMDMPNEWKRKRIEKMKQMIIDEQKKGENFLIYPAGKLKLTPDEQIGGASLIHDLMNKNPEMDVVLVRTTGLWGSLFSSVETGRSPDFGPVLWRGLKILFKNGIFFAPRREVIVELEKNPKDLPRSAERRTFNRFLEQWYNKDGPEPLKLVSFAFWKQELPALEYKEKKRETQAVQVPPEVAEQVKAQISKLSRFPIDKIEPQLHLSNDLGLDSLDISQLAVFLEERLGIEGVPPGNLHTVEDVLNGAAGAFRSEVETREEASPKKPSRFTEQSARPSPQIPEGETLLEVLLKSADRMGAAVACADRLSGVLSYNKFKQAILVLSQKIAELPGDKIGIMLPSSIGAYLAICSTWMAGKVPVMLNWTTGPRNLNHAIETTQLKAVLSSFRFLSRLDNGDLGKVDDLLILLEDMRSTIPLSMKLKGLFKSFKSASSLLENYTAKKEDPAVIIFTSGTETLPKGVPLSHHNILSNLRAAMETIDLAATDSLYGVLPPFHSFGFSVTGLFPLLTGIKVCFAPDPTDSKAMAEDIDHFEPTLFCCAPSFTMAMLQVAKKEQLKSLRLIVTGAEKTPQELFDRIAEIGGIAHLEGYGISECSPIVTIDRLGEPHKGVGKALPGVSLCTIDPESNKPLPQGEEGEICIEGPNVFAGYLGVKKDPFVELDGKKWYRSGDRGYVDQDGTLILTGRLTRFVKIGGEMVSLGAIEEELLAWSKGKSTVKEGPPLAVGVITVDGEKPEIVLFSTFSTTREEVNKLLKDKGHGRLVKVGQVREVEQIPVTGTGKTHYRVLEESAHG